MAEMKEAAVAFACESDRSELSPTHVLSEELCHQAGVRYEDVFTDAAAMARISCGLCTGGGSAGSEDCRVHRRDDCL